MVRSRALFFLVVGPMAACAPELNWRDVRPDGALQVLFPCKPNRQTRVVPLGGRPVSYTLHACDAGGATWAVGFGDIADPAHVGSALRDLQTAAAANIGARDGEGLAGPALPALQAGAEVVRLRLTGRLPDGAIVHEEVVTFAHGLRVFHAAVVSREDRGSRADPFFESLHLPGAAGAPPSAIR